MGSNTITAAFSGDGSFNAATSAPVNEVVQDFTFNLSGNSSQTIDYGGTATYTLAVASVDGPSVPSAIGFSVSGQPRGSTVTFSPATLPGGSGASSITVTIQVPSVIAAAKAAHLGSQTLAAFALLSVAFPFRRKLKLRGRFASGMMLLLAAACASVMLTGCGANIITPRVQTFAVTVTATSGALSHSTAATLIVQ
jgi:hypothetical protein